MRIAFLVLAVVAFGLSACGPIYGTEARLTPPESDQGRQCAAQCRATRQQCNDAAERRADERLAQCERDADRAYRDCRDDARDAEARSACERRRCTRDAVDVAHCETDFHACYSDCGGRVDFERVCLFNCP